MKRVVVAALALLVLGSASARGQGCPPLYAQDFDTVTPPALPADWTATQGMNVTGAPMWVTSAITPDTPPNDVFSTAPDNILDNRLDTTPISVHIFDNSVTFRHSYDLEEGLDGAVLEISTPSINGGSFTDITDPAVGGLVSPPYNSVISSATQSPIAGRMAWSGNSNGYVSVHIILGFVGMNFSDNVVMRFRLATDNSGASGGWRVDTFRWHHNECPPPPSPSQTPSPTATPTATPSATPTPTLTPTPSPTASPTPAHPINISTRLRVETGDRVIIGGFIVTGNVPKKVAIRGVGPSLANSGLSDVLADPTLELFDSDGSLAQNDNWQDDPAQAAQLTALGLALQNPNESGIVATLPPGRYTAVMAGKNQTSGIGLVEIYDADPAAASQLANISTRGFVRTGDNVMIGGFILGHGSGSANVIIRGIGPSLSHFMLPDFLADPVLELRDANGALLIANDNWQDDSASAAQLIAYGLQPSDPAESGIFASLAPGAFTAIVAGKNGDVGSALVEVYNVHPRVTITADSGPGSLRDAIAGASDGDTIQFDTALHDQAINLTSGELVIDKSITISGFLFNHVTVQPSLGLHSRIFHIMPGRTVTIEGLTIRGGGGPPNFAAGGGVLNENATLTLRYCTVEDNTSFGGYGGGIFSVGSSATLTIVNSSVNNNSVSGGPSEGGGINSTGILTIINSTVSGNNSVFSTGRAGGIFSNGTLTISNSAISGNIGGAEGGGILCGGSATITNSTVEGNTATGTGGGIKNSATLTITNSTISGNTASSNQAGRGGGIFSDFSATLTIAHSTFSGNSADGSGGGINLGNGTLHIGNTVLKAGASGANLVNTSGAVISHGYNLSSDNGGGFLNATGDQINIDPMLGPLQNNGGPTFTHALLTGSPAINAGDPNFTPPPSSDQRGPGYPRVIGGRIDIGSFEFDP